MIERADHAFGSESFGTTAEEQGAGESLDQRLAEERASSRSSDDATLDVEVAIQDADAPDDEPELLGEASLERDPFVAPEEAAMTVRDEAPGGVDHGGDEYVELYDESQDQD
jgi:hypothetical protein